MGETMRRELDAIEAASKPLPLQGDDEELKLKGKGRMSGEVRMPGSDEDQGGGMESPLGPL